MLTSRRDLKKIIDGLACGKTFYRISALCFKNRKRLIREVTADFPLSQEYMYLYASGGSKEDALIRLEREWSRLN